MSQPSPSDHDVRMRGFTRRTTVAEAMDWIDRQSAPLGEETVPLEQAFTRALARDVASDVDVPGFARAMMDGFALRAADTLGASAYNRLALEVIGESMPGRPFAGRVGPGQAVRIMTGAPLPNGADAVLPAELVEIHPGRILAQGDVPPEKHVGRRGEDITAGEIALRAGRVLRPQDLGLLASIGVAQVPVVRRPRARIVVTGDELLPAGSKPEGAKIVDANGPMLRALVERDGGVAVYPGIVPDRPEAILEAIREEADVVLVSGGSSVGQEDHAPELLRRHGELAIHGLAMRPSSPAGMGTLDGRLVFLLPGNPVSCLCAYDFFARRAIRRMAGQSVEWPYRRVTLPLGRKIVSTVGRLDYLRVRIVGGRVEPLAIGGASILSSTTRADGFVLVPPDSEGQGPDSQVEVFLYD
ncbi:MAG: molybdopterin molybdotransferase MoeA [Planctomycetia bacterium]|nr:molybdopterin molybdotransferase MoeA [Planctomycetia bacterium]